MRLLLDMNLSPQRGHDVIHWSEVGDPRASDETLMGYARQHEFVVITHDLDFGALSNLMTAWAL